MDDPPQLTYKADLVVYKEELLILFNDYYRYINCHIDCTVLCCHYVICVPIIQAVDGNGPSLASL